MERTSCARAFDVPLEEWLLDQAPELSEFRQHCKTCLSCAQQLLVQQRLVGALTRAGSHPSNETLLALRRDPEALGAAKRAELEAHFRVCGDCRTTVAAFAALRSPSARGRAPTRARAWRRQLRWLPAAAAAGLAAAVLLGSPTLFQQVRGGSGGAGSGGGLAGSPDASLLRSAREPALPGLARVTLAAAQPTVISADLLDPAGALVLEVPWPADRREPLMARLLRAGSDDALEARLDPPAAGAARVDFAVAAGWLRSGAMYRLELRAADASLLRSFALDVPAAH